MTDPITPPPKLVREWMERTQYDEHTWFYESYIAEQAARWGADVELEACCKYLSHKVTTFSAEAHLEAQRRSDELRAARRPKPPSLKEQALAALNKIEDKMLGPTIEEKLIRRALEQLDD